jgi:beta-lactamase regulating signal transducer with metallopeptidase domain
MYFITRSLLLKVLGWSLINSLWQIAFLWLLYILITGTGNRFSARAKHNLALLFSAAGTTWFIFTLVGSIGNEDLFFTGFTTIVLSTGSRFSGILSFVKNIFDLSLPYLSFIYLGTLLVLSLRYIKYYTRLRQTKLSGLHKIKPELRLFTGTVALQMGIRRKVSVWLSSIVDSPMTIGFLKPVILIPIATINHLSTEQVESILLHELTHIKRNDYLVNLFITITGIIFFFNPFSRLFIYTIKKEREHCCDDVVMQFQYKPHAYASALLSLEKTRHQHHQLAMAAIGKSNQLLLERVKRVTGHTHNARRYSLPLICFFLLAMIIGFTLMIKPMPMQPVSKLIPANEIKYWQAIEPLHKEQYIKGQYIFTSSVKEKNKKPACQKNKTEIIERETRFPENDIHYASNAGPGQENPDEENNISNADQSEPMVFSIAAPRNPSVPVVGSNDFPYVPNSSFSFQSIKDSAESHEKIDYKGIVTDENMQKALTLLNAIDWKKIEMNISRDGKKVDINKLQTEIFKSIEQSNSVKISADVALVINERDENKIRDNIRRQLITLRNLKITNRPPRCLQRSAPAPRTMEHREVKKQLESIRKAQEILKTKVLRIIYI